MQMVKAAVTFYYLESEHITSKHEIIIVAYFFNSCTHALWLQYGTQYHTR